MEAENLKIILRRLCYMKKYVGKPICLDYYKIVIYIESTKRIEKNLVESVPLREALINAVVQNVN